MKSKGFQVVDYTKSEDGDRWLPLTEQAKRIIKRIEAINEEYGHQYKDFYLLGMADVLHRMPWIHK